MPDTRLPAHLARRVLSGDLSIEAAEHEARATPPGRSRLMADLGGEVSGEPIKARARQSEDRGADGLNRTERRYVDEVLVPAMAAGEVFSFEAPCPIKVRIGPTWRCAFAPDVLVIGYDSIIEFVDVKAARVVSRADGSKGHRPLSQDDATAKIQAAGRLYPWARWVVVYPIPARDGGGWARKVVA